MDHVLSFWNFLKSLGEEHGEAPLGPRGPRPRIGRRAVLGDLRITIQAGFSEELWSWMMDQGWRELVGAPDRRQYREVPSRGVTRLIDCEPCERSRILDIAMAMARSKPTVGDPRMLPAYVLRD